MDRFFNMDNKFFTFMSRVADLIILNLLCIVCCIPVVTIGPSIAAMFYVTLKMVRNEESYIVRGFFKSFKQNLKQGIVINLIMLAAALLLYFDISICRSTPGTIGKVLMVLFMMIDLSNQRFSIHYTRNVVSTDFGGEPCLLVYYDYTNNGESSSSAMVDVNLTAYQNDAALEAAIPANSDEAVDAFMKEIQPGETVNVCQAFSLNDMSPVTLHASDAFGLDTGITAAQTLNLQ